MTTPKPLRIAFIHPDLGIGGAERLVVDAAIGLSRLGHSVKIYTSSHQPERAFIETTDGTIDVKLLGNNLFPRSIKNRFITICAILRQLHLTFNLIVSRLFSDEDSADLYFVDQLSASIPLLRYATRTRVLFYCHFPDLLLSPVNINSNSFGTKGWILSKLKSTYRIPLDWLEEYTTANADTILVNSHFTAEVFGRTMTSIKKKPQVVYPGVDINIYDCPKPDQPDQKPSVIHSDRPTILSINRFEEKKNINLLLQAYIQLRKSDSAPGDSSLVPRLVLAGGYDERLMDNRRTLKALQDSVPKDLVQLTLSTEDVEGAECMPDVLFLLNVSQEHKLALLHGRSTKLLGYTASNEHLGIGPLEAMACRLPVLAVDSGGPKETVSDTRTGFLVPPDPERWAQSIRNILAMDDQQRRQMGDAGRDRVLELFSTEVMAKHFERAIRDILSPVRQTDLWLEQGFFHLLAFIFVPFLTIWVGTWKFM
ncbi:Alpha-1,3-mannosyltransferase-like protein [Puccinia graminis f. sp. tritici]|uniref:Alpha-1,3/1,6-mannosyltransferase ALG2 n=2 Tax=Puccinia graminis f. sp. tritici TaxID=56615 RepID=A0A5B0QU63_PUCGR|nr:Alpha-1,3-mannosyltransferase-like protein [Puccinia graminis f. sp. tritici]